MLKKFNSRIAIFSLLALLSVLAPASQAAIDTNLTTIVTDMTTYWESIKVLILAVVVFGIGIHYANKVRR